MILFRGYSESGPGHFIPLFNIYEIRHYHLGMIQSLGGTAHLN